MDTAEKERREILAGEYEAEGQKGWSGHLLKYGPFEKEHAALRAMAEAERRAFERGRAAGREEAGWRDIESAPKDGTVILTDEGTCSWQDDLHGWYLSFTGGGIPRCADWGREVSEAHPSIWRSLPTPPLSKREGAERKPCTCSDETIARVNAGDICGMGGCPYGGDL